MEGWEWLRAVTHLKRGVCPVGDREIMCKILGMHEYRNAVCRMRVNKLPGEYTYVVAFARMHGLSCMPVIFCEAVCVYMCMCNGGPEGMPVEILPD